MDSTFWIPATIIVLLTVAALTGRHLRNKNRISTAVRFRQQIQTIQTPEQARNLSIAANIVGDMETYAAASKKCHDFSLAAVLKARTFAELAAAEKNALPGSTANKIAPAVREEIASCAFGIAGDQIDKLLEVIEHSPQGGVTERAAVARLRRLRG